MSRSSEERDFMEGMARWDDSDHEDFEQQHDDFESPLTLLDEIRGDGAISVQRNTNEHQNREIENQRRDMERYGSQNSMENFIVEVLELDMNDENVRRMMEWGEATDYIINEAVKAINSGPKKEIHFTPIENTEYKKIKAIYDKLADDLKQMVCRRMDLSRCRNSDEVITRAIQQFPEISDRFRPGMTFGYKLKVIEEWFSKANARGRKTKRRRTRQRKTRQRKTRQRKTINKRRRTKGKQ